jgi:HlyD family secretion protein
MNKRWWIAAVAVALIAALSLAGCQPVAPQGAGTGGSAETAVVRRGTLLVTVDATGSLAPGAEVSLSFSSGGRVADVLVDEGQVVEAGQPLARLETDDLELQVVQAQAALAATEAQLAQLLAPPRPQEVAVQEANLAAAQAQVSAAAADRDQVSAGPDEGQIADAEAQLASATAQQKSAFDMHERTMNCRTFKLPAGTTLPDGTVLTEDVEETICPGLGAPEEQSRYALAVADASLAAARAQLDELQAGADADQVRAAQANVATAAAQRDAAQAQIDLLLAGSTAEEIETAQASVDDARVALEQARLRLEKATLAAPVAGTITLLDVQPGEIATANQPVVVLSDLATLEVEVNLDETDVARVAVGQQAQVRLDAFPGVEMAGEVTYVASVAQSQSGVVLFPVTVLLSPVELPVRAGMTADVEIATASREDALIVPLRAVHTEDGRATVERLASDQVERVEVALGLVTGTEIEITDGLSEGDVVVVVASAPQDSSGQMPGPMGMFGGETTAQAQASTETAVVRQDTLQITVEGTGSLAPRAEAQLAFLSGGQVAGIRVAEGQVVEAGQVLVQLETDELGLEVARAEAALATAEGQLAQSLASPRPQEVVAQEANLAAAQGQVSAAVASRDQVAAGPDASQIAAAETQVATAEMEYRASLRTYDSIDKKDKDRKEQANYDLWAAQVALEATQAQLDVLLAGADADEVRAARANVSAAVAQRDAAQAQLDLLLAGATEEQVQAAEAAVDQARVALEQARLQLERATLAAPMGGTVTTLDVEIGELVSLGQLVVVLSDLATLEVDVNLDETDVAHVAVGQKAWVDVDAFPGVRMAGQVTYVASVAQSQSGVVLFPVTVRLSPVEPPVRAGMTADVEITTASHEGALIVPLRAVHTGDGRATVERVEVTLGLTTDTEAEIASGLAAGDVVVVVAGPSQDSGARMPGPMGRFMGGD